MVLSENELITNMIFCQLNLDAFTLITPQVGELDELETFVG
jgi:hypothetical protein